MRHRKQKKKPYAAAIMAVAFFLCACVAVFALMWPEEVVTLYTAPQVSIYNQPSTPPLTPVPTQAPTHAPTQAPTPEPLGTRTIRLRAVGDLMVHDRQLLSCVDEEGQYSFESSFASILPYLEEADIVIGNLETTIAEKNFSGFPSFRSPIEFIDALEFAGFDVLTFANNHTYDGRTSGIERTLNAVRERSMHITGAYASKEDAEETLVLDVSGVKIGILAYADMAFRAEAWQINTFDDLTKIQRDIDKAREMGADIVCVMAHWGEEYVLEPTDRQQARAKQLCRMGADIILGSHPHIVQPGEWITAQTQDGEERRSFVFYSMGNFLSNQKPSDENGRAATDGGVILDIQIEKNLDTGEITAIEIAAIPTFVLRRNRPDKLHTYDILPIEAALAVPEDESDLTGSERRRMRKVLEYALSSLGEIPTLHSLSANPDAPENLAVNMQ